MADTANSTRASSAEGNFSRRSFLAGLGLTAGAVTTTAAVAMERAGRPEENPELLRLGAVIDQRVQAFEDATAAKEAARARYEAIKPSVPEELIVEHPDPFARDFADPERDVENKVVGHGGREIVSSYRLGRGMRSADGRTIRGRRIRKLLPIAERYEQDAQVAREESGWEAAERAHLSAYHDLLRLADQACAAEAVTIRGVEIQAKAILAAVNTGGDAIYHPTRWGPALVNSVIAVAGRA